MRYNEIATPDSKTAISEQVCQVTRNQVPGIHIIIKQREDITYFTFQPLFSDVLLFKDLYSSALLQKSGY